MSNLLQSLRRSGAVVAALSGAILMVAAQAARADDGDGLQQFFSSIFGGDRGSAAQPVQRQEIMPTRRGRAHPLTVHLRARSPNVAVAQKPSKPLPVSIYADRTLRKGDAVMMRDGVRVFIGSTSWPYSDGDFVKLAHAREFDDGKVRALAALDRLPRG